MLARAFDRFGLMEAQDTAADIRWYDATQFRFLLAVDGRTVQARGFPRSNSCVLPIRLVPEA